MTDELLEKLKFTMFNDMSILSSFNLALQATNLPEVKKHAANALRLFSKEMELYSEDKKPMPKEEFDECMGYVGTKKGTAKGLGAIVAVCWSRLNKCTTIELLPSIPRLAAMNVMRETAALIKNLGFEFVKATKNEMQ